MSNISPTPVTTCTASLSRVNVNWSFRFSDTRNYLRNWIIPSGDTAGGSVGVSDSAFSDWASFGNPIDAFAEFCLLCQPTSEKLFQYNRCIIHAAAVRFHDRAFLISAGSGVGKSTQVRTLKDLYPGEITVINGDKPILECHDDGSVIVHPSPWNGKEGWHGAEAATLGGIFLLQRGDKNSVMPMKKTSAVSFLYLQIFQSFTSEKVIRQAGALTEKVLENTPVWHFVSRDVPDSTQLMYEAMLSEVTSHGL